VQTGREKIWPFGRNKKIKLKKVKRNKPKITKISIEKMRNREMAAL